MKKVVFWVVFVGFVCFLFFYLFSKEERALVEEEGEEVIVIEKETKKTEESETYTLLFAGDIMLDRGVRYMVEKYGEDYTFPFLNISEKLESADVLFGNLESMISDKGFNQGSIYSFRASPDSVAGLVFAGFDVLSLANNHTFDYGREAFEDTMKRLKENGILYTGAGFNAEEAHTPTITKLEDGTTVGFLGYTEFLFPSAYATEEKSGVTTFSLDNMKEDIQEARESVDILVVTLHFGEEYQKIQNKNQEHISKTAVDSGADIVIGHHPHVTQEVEEYNGKYIAYSLGNFVFDQSFSEETMSGFMIEAKVKNKEVVGVSKIHYKLNKYYQPEVVEVLKVDENDHKR